MRPEPHFERQEPNSLWCYLKKLKSASCSVMSDSFQPHGLMDPEIEPTLALQAPLSMEFSRQEYWSG